MLSFRKSKQTDAWCAFGPASECKPGPAEITTKSGATRNVTIVSVSRPFDIDGIPHCYGDLADSAPSKPLREDPHEMLPDGKPAHPHLAQCPDCGCRFEWT